MTTEATAVMLRLRLAGATVGLGGKGVWFYGPEPIPKSLLAKARQRRDDIAKVLKVETVPAQSAAHAAATSDAVARVAEYSLNGRTHRAIPANRLIKTVRSSVIASRTFVTLRRGGVQRRIRQRLVRRVRASAENNGGRAMNQGGVARLVVLIRAAALGLPRLANRDSCHPHEDI